MAANEPAKSSLGRETVNFAVSVVEIKGEDKQYKCRNSVRKFSTDEMWFDIFCDVYEHITDEIDKNF